MRAGRLAQSDRLPVPRVTDVKVTDATVPTTERRRHTSIPRRALLVAVALGFAFAPVLSTVLPQAQRAPAAPQPFDRSPVGANPKVVKRSAAMIARSLLPFVGSANLANSLDWGIPIVRASVSDPVRRVGSFRWSYDRAYATPLVRIPDDARPSTGSDHHLVVLDGGRELDMWVARQRPDGKWRAGARHVLARNGPLVVPKGGVGATASNIALSVGVVRPGEIAAGRIDHALAFTTPAVRRDYVAPATHSDGRTSARDAMPMGTRIQLDPAVDISGLPRPTRVIAQALKTYGAYLVDSSHTLALRAEATPRSGEADTNDAAWGAVGVTDSSLRELPWARMRVVAPPGR